MKEKLKELSDILGEEERVKKLDLALGLLAVFFFGVIIGYLTSPKRVKTNNFGNNYYKNGGGTKEAEKDCAEGRFCDDCAEERCCGEKEYCGNGFRCCEDGPDEADHEEKE